MQLLPNTTLVFTSKEVEVRFGATANLDMKHGASNLVTKQTKGVISKVCCLAHDSVTNDLVKKQIGIGLSESQAETKE